MMPSVALSSPWIDLTPYWDQLRGFASAVLGQKQSYKTHLPLNKDSDFIGACGEMVMSITLNRPMDMTLRAEGDGGSDLIPGMNIKATPRAGKIHLIEFATPRHWADVYVLIQIDVVNKRGRIVGWATRSMLEVSPVVDFGYGPRHAIEAEGLLSFPYMPM